MLKMEILREIRVKALMEEKIGTNLSSEYIKIQTEMQNLLINKNNI